MARLIFEAVEFYSDSGFTTLVGRIEGVRTDDLTLDKEGNVVTVDNGREINESFSGNIEFVTRNTSYEASAGGTADGEDILGGANSPVTSDGTVPSETYVKFVGRNNSHDINCGASYVNAMEQYSNDRLEVAMSLTLEEVDQSDVMTSATATGS